MLQWGKMAEKGGKCLQTLEHNAFRILEETSSSEVLKCGRSREGIAKTAEAGLNKTSHFTVFKNHTFPLYQIADFQSWPPWFQGTPRKATNHHHCTPAVLQIFYFPTISSSET